MSGITFGLSVFMVVLGIVKLGTSQESVVALDRVFSRVTCENEIQQFDCEVSGGGVQWIAEPFINGTGSGFVSFNNVESSNGVVVARGSGIITVEQLAANPLLTRMSISGNLSSDLTIVCVALGENSSRSMDYVSGSRLFQPPSNLALRSLLAEFDDGHIEVSFLASQSPNVLYYVVSIKDAISVQVNGTETSLRVPASILGTETEVCVCGVNRCGVESERICAKVTVKTIPGYASVVILFPITLFVLIILSIVITILGCIMFTDRNRVHGAETVEPGYDMK